MATAVSRFTPIAHDRPEVRRIGFADLWASLREGWADFMAIPTQLVFLCVLYPVIGMVAARSADGGPLLPLLFPLVAGLALLGPVLATGLYELSRRREAGLTVSWRNAFDVLRSPALPAIAGLGAVLLVLFVLWIAVARAIYAGTIGPWAPETLEALMAAVWGTSEGWRLAVFGNLAGAVFAAMVLSLSAVSFPMLLDRDCSAAVAVATSLRVVRTNPVVMTAWGVLVAGVLALGCLPLFVGLAVAMPVLGHATWHLYRRVAG